MGQVVMECKKGQTKNVRVDASSKIFLVDAQFVRAANGQIIELDAISGDVLYIVSAKSFAEASETVEEYQRAAKVS
jgi:hypothetical protein